jgi:hypothetical protein
VEAEIAAMDDHVDVDMGGSDDEDEMPAADPNEGFDVRHSAPAGTLNTTSTVRS